MSRRAAIYVRISKDKTGAGLGVARQRADCEALAASLGWSVVGVYEDTRPPPRRPPAQAVAVLEHAITAIEPANEALYQLLIRLHQRHGRHAAARALQFLTAALTAIDAEPSPATVAMLNRAVTGRTEHRPTA